MLDTFARFHLCQRLKREQVTLLLKFVWSCCLSFKVRGSLGILIHIERAAPNCIDEAYAIVQEYYEAVGVMVRDDRAAFARDYFASGAGVWLASEDGKIVGCIALRPLPQFEHSGEIKRMYVKPESRGQRIAERLLQALEDYARAVGYHTLYLDTKDDLTAAIRFYQRHGYEPCERYNDNPQATIFMRKSLATG